MYFLLAWQLYILGHVERAAAAAELPRRGPERGKLAKRCWFWLRCEVCYSFLHSQHVCAGARLGFASPNIPLPPPPTSRTLAHSLKISFSLVFRLFGIRFGFSSVDFMNLTLFGCGSLCRRQATGGAECLRREACGGAWLVAKVAASTWQTAADGLKVAVCVTLPGKYS